jgi:hypothetical protein
MRTPMPPLCVIALLFVVIGGATADAEEPADLGSANLGSAAPGQTVTIPFQAPKRPQDAVATRVTIGGRDAPIARSEAGFVTVYVPNVAPDELAVRVYVGIVAINPGRITVVSPPYRRFLFAREGNGLEIVRVAPTAGEPDGNVRSMDARLSFDLVDGSGRLLYSTSVLDPAATLNESFAPAAGGGPMALGRSRVEHRSVFPVRLPAVSGARELRVYRAPAGLDIFGSEGRQQRILLRRFALRGGEWTQK